MTNVPKYIFDAYLSNIWIFGWNRTVVDISNANARAFSGPPIRGISVQKDVHNKNLLHSCASQYNQIILEQLAFDAVETTDP